MAMTGLELLHAEMARQGADAIASLEAAVGAAEQVGDSIRRTGRLVLLGMGASHWVNRSAEIMYRRAGIEVASHPLSEVLVTPLPDRPRTVIVTSQSGRSGEVLLYLDQPAHAEERFGLTLDPDGDLAKRLPCLLGQGGAEIAFAATRSLLVCLALHSAVLSDFKWLEPGMVEALMYPPAPDVAPALAALSTANTLVLTARGELVGIAEAGALCLMELGRQPALGLEGAQLRHGPLEAIGPDTGIIALRGPGQAAGLVAGLVRDCREAGAPCVVFDCSGETPIADTTTIVLPRADGYTAIFSVVPVLQRLLIERAATQVVDVGCPVRSTKVTTVI